MDKTILFHTSTPAAELLRLAASQKQISRSEFIRQAIKEKATRILTGTDTAAAESA